MAKRYYWLKLKEDFFDDDTIQWIEEQPNGGSYCLFYLKLCLKSLKTDGILIRKVGQMLVPYDVDRLAEVTRTPVDTVRVAMELFKNLGVIQILENGEIEIAQFRDMVGSETDKAALMRKKRAEKKAKLIENTEVKQIGNSEEHHGNNVTEVLENRYTELELKKELKLKKDIQKDLQKDLKKDDRVIEEVSEKYKNICRSLPAAELTENDLVNIAAALGAGYTFEDIWKVFHIAEENDFLKGKNEHKWQASLSWLLKPKNMEKVLSGKYDRREKDIDEEAAMAAIVAAARESPEDPEAAFDALPEACQKLIVSPLRLRGLAKAKEEAIRELVARKIKETK